MTISAQDAHEFPIYAGRYRVYFPVLDADGDLVTAMTTPDSERSIDGATFADCTAEATEVATGSGVYYLDLTSTEMTSKCTAVIVKSATAGMKTTVLTLYPKRMPILRSGTAQAGGASSITLDAGASAKDDAYIGMWIQITNNSPANVLGQTRKITDYVGSTKVATVEGAWGTNPSVASTFSILLPETVNINAWMGKETADWATSGHPARTDLIPGTQDGRTYAETILLMASVLLGKVSGLPTAPIFRALDDSQNRITATTDAQGNRTAVTYDVSSP
jgi:hypothetical protein